MRYNRYDEAEGQLQGMRFPQSTRLRETLVVGLVTAAVAAKAFGSASGATNPQQLWPGVIGGLVALAGASVIWRRTWQFDRNRQLAEFCMGLVIGATALAAGHALRKDVLFRAAFGPAPAEGVRLVSADRGVLMTSPSLLVMKLDRPSLDALLAAAGPFVPPTDVERLPAHLAALLPPDLQAGDFRRMLGPAHHFANRLHAGPGVLVLRRTIPGSLDTFFQPRLVQVLWDPTTSLAHVVITYPEADE